MYDKDIVIRMKQSNKTWFEIGEVFGTDGENVRAWAKKQDWFHKIREEEKITDVLKDKVKEQTHDRKNGIITSNINKRLKEQQTFTDDELLELHGIPADTFQIRTITSNEWGMTNAEGEQFYNLQSKIVAEPKVKEITPEFVAKLIVNAQPNEINLSLDEVPDSYLLAPFGDFHWGLNYLEDYIALEKDIADRIIEGHSEILFVLGGDYFHVDNFENTTERGTRVDDVDVERATADAFQFLLDMLDLALEHSPYVKLVYLPGNHAPMVDYMFIQGIKRLRPQIEVDDEVKEYKHAWLGEHSIFLHHANKRRTTPKLLEVFVSDYAKEWGQSKSRYLITFHFHHEKSLSNAGMTHYQVQSPSKLSSYDKQQGHTGSEQGLMLFEFDDVKRRAIYYL